MLVACKANAVMLCYCSSPQFLKRTTLGLEREKTVQKTLALYLADLESVPSSPKGSLKPFQE